MKSYMRFIVLLGLVAIGAGIYMTPLRDYFSFDYLIHHKLALKEYVNAHYYSSLLIYLSIYVLVVFFMLPITLVLNIAAGYLFGVVPGTIASVICATVGATVSLLAFRYLLGDWALARYGKRLEKFTKNFKENGMSYLISLQLLPVTPFPIINISAGLSGIPLSTFMLSTLIGITPATFIYCLAGSQLAHISSAKEIMSWQMIVVFMVMACMALVPTLLKRFKGSKG